MTDTSGSAFPIQHQTDPNGEVRMWAEPGMTKRELFAAILMHSEAVTCGVPGEACDALIEASAACGQDPVDHMATNAVEGADALLRALAAPKPPQYRELHPYDQRRLDAAERLANAVNAVRDGSEFVSIPADERERITRAIDDVLDPEIPF